jgi:hypothetical protein
MSVNLAEFGAKRTLFRFRGDIDITDLITGNYEHQDAPTDQK